MPTETPEGANTLQLSSFSIWRDRGERLCSHHMTSQGRRLCCKTADTYSLERCKRRTAE